MTELSFLFFIGYHGCRGEYKYCLRRFGTLQNRMHLFLSSITSQSRLILNLINQIIEDLVLRDV